MIWEPVTTSSETKWPADDELTLVHMKDERYLTAQYDKGRRVWFCVATNSMLRNVSHWAKIEPVPQ